MNLKQRKSNFTKQLSGEWKNESLFYFSIVPKNRHGGIRSRPIIISFSASLLFILPINL